MAGTGAMYGALDVGLLITGSSDGARRLKVEVEARDFAAPEALGVVILGNGSGEHGGFTYADTATLALDASAAEDRDLVLELETLFADGKWRLLDEAKSKKDGIGANKDEVRAILDGTPERFVRIDDGRLVGRAKQARPYGTLVMRDALAGENQLELANRLETREPVEPVEPVLSPNRHESRTSSTGSLLREREPEPVELVPLSRERLEPDIPEPDESDDPFGSLSDTDEADPWT
jgi:hypothetical protein